VLSIRRADLLPGDHRRAAGKPSFITVSNDVSGVVDPLVVVMVFAKPLSSDNGYERPRAV
jgi:hypothetical protein